MSLEQELKSEKVTHLDLTEFCVTIQETAVQDVVTLMRSQKCNVCLVVDEDRKLVGIFTDRDVLRKVAGSPQVLTQPVHTLMTAQPITISPETSAAEALWLMDERGIRNLPVVNIDGTVLGDMNYMAIINYLAARYPKEVLNRPPRPDQFPRRAEGGD